MSETFGLTGVEIEERKPLRHRILSQNTIRPKTVEKLPMISEKKIQQQQQQQYETPQKNLILKNIQAIKTSNGKNNNRSIEKGFKMRSISQQNLPSGKKLELFRRNLEKNRDCITSESQNRKLYPKSSGSFLQQYDNKIKTDLDALYSSDQLSKIMSNLRISDKKYALNLQIEKNQKILQKEMGLSNNIHNEVLQRKKLRDQLDVQIQSYMARLDKKQEFGELKLLEEESNGLKNEIGALVDYSKILQHMLKQRQKQIIYNKNQVNILIRELKQVQLKRESQQNMNMNEKQSLIQSTKQLCSLALNGPLSMDNISLGGRFEDMLEKELIEFENHKNVKELFEKERRLQMQKIQERKEFMMEERARRKEIQEQRLRELEEEHEKVDVILKKYNKKFEKIRRVSQKQSVQELKGYNQEIQNKKQDLKDLEHNYLQKIQEEKQEIKELQQRLKQMKYEQKEVFQEEDQQEDDQNQDGEYEEINIHKLKLNKSISTFKLVEDKDQRKRQEEVQLNILQEKIKRFSNTIDTYCMSIGRIMGQAQFQDQKYDKYELGREKLLEKMEEVGKQLGEINQKVLKQQQARQDAYGGDDEFTTTGQQKDSRIKNRKRTVQIKEKEYQKQEEQEEQEEQYSQDEFEQYNSIQNQNNNKIISSPPKYLGLQKSNFQRLKESEVQEEISSIKKQYKDVNDYFREQQLKQKIFQDDLLDSNNNSVNSGYEQEIQQENRYNSVKDSDYNSEMYQQEEEYERMQLEQMQSDIKLRYKQQQDKAKFALQKKREEEEARYYS